MLNLKVEPRAPESKLNTLRKEGKIPAVFYGRVEKSTPISLDAKAFKKVLSEAGESTVISLDDGSNKHDVLIKDVDVDPVSGEYRHADFYVVEKGKKVIVSVPLEFTGTSPAVKDLGGQLVKVLHEIEIEAEPANLPQNVEVDISDLNTLDSQLLIKDLKLPNGVEATALDEDVVASITVAKEEEEEAAPADISSIEVEKKGKEKNEGEGGDAPAEAPKEGENKE